MPCVISILSAGKIKNPPARAQNFIILRFHCLLLEKIMIEVEFLNQLDDKMNELLTRNTDIRGYL